MLQESQYTLNKRMAKYFIALIPDETLGGVLADTAWSLPEDWIPTEEPDLHLTLLFLGETDERARVHIETIIENVVRHQNHFYFRGGRLVVMRPDEPYMIWVRYDEERALTEFVRELEQRFVKIGDWRPEGHGRYKFGNKAPVPHITLGRMQGGRLADSLISPIVLPPRCRSIHLRSLGLYESLPGVKEGEIRYKLLRSWALR